MAMKVLHVFDFDDTLVSSDSRVIIICPDGSTKTLTSEEYSRYKLKPGEVEDFSEFDTFPKNPEIIEPVFAELKASIAIHGLPSVVILTARSNPNPVTTFFKINRIHGIHVEAVGSSDPMKKAIYILNRLKSDDGISEVTVYEDNVKNIRTIRKVVGKTGVSLKTNRVSNGYLINQDKAPDNE